MDSKEKAAQLSEFVKELVGLLQGTFGSDISASEVGLLLKKLRFVVQGTPIDKLLGCELMGCHELNYFKRMYTQLDDDIAVVDKNRRHEKIKVKLRNIHSIKRYDHSNSGFKESMVRLINGTEYVLCDTNLNAIRQKYPVAFIYYSRWELLCLSATSSIYITDRKGEVCMHGWGDRLYTIPPDKLQELQLSKSVYDHYLAN